MSDDFGSISIEAPEKIQPQKRSPHAPSKSAPPPTEIPQKAASPKRSAGAKLVALIFAFSLILLIAGYSLLGFWGVPHYIGKALPSYIAKHSDFTLKTGKISANPYTFSLELDNLQLQKSGKNLLFIDKISLVFVPQSLLKREFVTSSTKLLGVRAELEKSAEQAYNFTSRLSNSANQEISLSSLLSGKNILLPFSLNNITVSNSSFIFRDIPSDKIHRGTDIELNLPTLGNIATAVPLKVSPLFSANLNGSQVRFTHNNSENDSLFRVQCKLQDLNLPLYYSYLSTGTGYKMLSGTGNGTIDILVNNNAPSKEMIQLELKLTADNSTLQKRDKSATIWLPQTELQATILPLSSSITVESMELNKPLLKLQKNISIANIFSALTYQTEQGEPPGVTIKKVQLQQGSISRAKKSEPASLANISLKISSHPDEKSALTIGKIADLPHAKVSWSGEITDNGATGVIHAKGLPLRLFFDSYQLPYSKKDRGTVALSSDMRLTGKGISYQNINADLSGVQLHQGADTWLKSKKITLRRGQLTAGSKQLGELNIHNAKLHLDPSAQPPLLKELLRSKGSANLHSLQIAGTAILTEKNRKLELKKFSLKATNLDKEQQNSDNFSLQASSKGGGQLQAAGRIKIHPLSLWLESKGKNIASKQLSSWLNHKNLQQNSNSKLSFSGRFLYPNPSFKGKLSSTDGYLNHENKKLISWRQLSLNDFTYNLRNHDFKCDTLSIEQPKLYWQQLSPSLSLDRALARISQTVNREAQNHTITIRKVLLKDGEIALATNETKPPWRATLTEVEGRFEPIDSGNRNTPLSLTMHGKLGKAPFSLQGTAQLFSSNLQREFRIQVNAIPLDLFKAQSPLLQDQIFAQNANLKIYQKGDNSNNKGFSEIEFLQIDPKDKQLALLFALLQAKRGSAKITLLEDAQTRHKPLLNRIEKKLEVLRVKTEISPFLLADKSFWDLSEKENIPFRFGQITPEKRGMEYLLRLKEFMAAYPKIALTIRGEASATADKAALQEQLQASEQIRVDKLNSKKMELWQQEQKQNSTPEGEFEEANIFIPIQPETVQVSPDMLYNLAQQRGKICAKLLKEQLGIAPERIILLDPEVSATSENRVHLTLRAK